MLSEVDEKSHEGELIDSFLTRIRLYIRKESGDREKFIKGGNRFTLLSLKT